MVWGDVTLLGGDEDACVLDSIHSHPVTTQGPRCDMELMVCVSAHVRAKEQNGRMQHGGRAKATWVW